MSIFYKSLFIFLAISKVFCKDLNNSRVSIQVYILLKFVIKSLTSFIPLFNSIFFFTDLAFIQNSCYFHFFHFTFKSLNFFMIKNDLILKFHCNCNLDYQKLKKKINVCSFFYLNFKKAISH